MKWAPVRLFVFVGFVLLWTLDISRLWYDYAHSTIITMIKRHPWPVSYMVSFVRNHSTVQFYGDTKKTDRDISRERCIAALALPGGPPCQTVASYWDTSPVIPLIIDPDIDRLEQQYNSALTGPRWPPTTRTATIPYLKTSHFFNNFYWIL